MRFDQIEVGQSYTNERMAKPRIRRVDEITKGHDVKWTDDKGRHGFCHISTFAEWATNKVVESGASGV